MSVLYHLVMELQLQVHVGQEFSRCELEIPGPKIVLPRIAATTRDRGFTRESLYSRHNGMTCPKPSSSSGLVYSSYQLQPDARKLRLRVPL